MNKLVLALATVAAFGLSTAAFAEAPNAPTSAVSTQIQPAQSQAPAAHKMRASHRAGEKKVVGRHLLHRTASHVRHYGHGRGKKVAVKHLPSKKTFTPKTAS
jgi:uncharacterized low-complexity protein